MPKHNAQNERIKRRYFAHLSGAHGRDEATIDGVAKALARFEEYTKARDFSKFRPEQAVAFRERLAEQCNVRTGERLSKATLNSTLRGLRAFFFWLADQPGFKSRIVHSDADYFRLSEKDTTIARATRLRAIPSLAQIERVLEAMPRATVLERRDRAVIAFAVLTGARVNALASFQLGHVNLAGGYVEQDARIVRTKKAKTFRTYFMAWCAGALEAVTEWLGELECDLLWGPADPLFPATRTGLDDNGEFTALGVAREGWDSTSPVREVFARAFGYADLPYFSPHSLRSMLVRHAMTLDLPPAQMKALSQNLGHADVMTTFTSYGSVPVERQGDLIRAISARPAGTQMDDASLVAELAKRLGKG